MHSSRKRRRRTVLGLVVFFLGGTVLGALTRPRPARAADAWSPEPEAPAEPRPTPVATAVRRRSFGARLAFASLFTAIFVGGAALTAFGGDQAAKLVQSEESAQALADAADASTDAVPADAAPAAESAPAPDPEAAPAPAPEPAPEVEAAPAPAPEETVPAPAPETAPAASDPAAAPVVDAVVVGGTTSSGSQGASRTPGRSAKRGTRRVNSANENPLAAPVVTVVAKPEATRVEHTLLAKRPKLDAEVHSPFTASVVWLNRALPDPTPPSKRLLRSFGRMLVHTSRDAGADWSLAYGILRAGGADGRVLASEATVQALATRLAELKQEGRDEWQSAAAVLTDTSLADRAVALAHYAHAVGLETLVRGLDASKERLTRRLLNDPRAWIYDGGRSDLEEGHVDVRVIAVVSYLADTFDGITVSCLVSGHRLYARPGVVSRHIYGEAADIAALGGVSILGHQEPGGVTEKAVRALLLLPGELEPQQIISLLGLGGPSFPLSNHDDHIHVGY